MNNFTCTADIGKFGVCDKKFDVKLVEYLSKGIKEKFKSDMTMA